MQTLCQHTEIFAALARRFEPWQVRTRKGGGGKDLSYITARTAMNRLDEVLGPENWSDAYKETRDGLMCSITITLPDGRSVTKTDGGGFADMPEEDNTEKSGYSDAFKRACVKFGIARYLYTDSIPQFLIDFIEGGGLEAPSAPPADLEPPPPTTRAGKTLANGRAAGGTDDRPFAVFVADAARKAGKPAMDYINRLMDDAIERGLLKDGLRDNHQKSADLSALYLHDKAWVQESIKAYFKADTAKV